MKCTATFLLCAILLTVPSHMFAGTHEWEPQPSSRFQDAQVDSSDLADSLRTVREKIERLQSIIEKVTFTPSSYYFTYLRSWLIPLSDTFNDTLAQYFFEATENDSSFIESRGDIQVISTPDSGSELISIYFAGSGKEKKGQRLRELLEKRPERHMYQRVLLSREFGEDRELLERGFRIKDVDAPRLIKDADSIIVAFDRYSNDLSSPNATVVTIHLFDQVGIRFGSDWGFEAKLGNEEIGLPFWQSGNLSFLVLYSRIKLGMHIPFAYGRPQDVSSGLGVLWKPRQLDGTYGIAGEFDWAFAGGAFSIGFPRVDPDGSFVDPDNIYSLRTMAQLWYSFAVNIGNNADMIRFKLGFGAHQIGYDRLDTATTTIVQVEPPRFFWSPYVRVEFMNQQFKKRFGSTVQYYRSRISGSVWLELIRDALRVEFQYTTIGFRPRDPWEAPYFFSLAIPYTFSF